MTHSDPHSFDRDFEAYTRAKQEKEALLRKQQQEKEALQRKRQRESAEKRRQISTMGGYSLFGGVALGIFGAFAGSFGWYRVGASIFMLIFCVAVGFVQSGIMWGFFGIFNNDDNIKKQCMYFGPVIMTLFCIGYVLPALYNTLPSGDSYIALYSSIVCGVLGIVVGFLVGVSKAQE